MNLRKVSTSNTFKIVFGTRNPNRPLPLSKNTVPQNQRETAQSSDRLQFLFISIMVNSQNNSYCRFRTASGGKPKTIPNVTLLFIVQILDHQGKPMSSISMNYQPQLLRFQPSHRQRDPPVKGEVPCRNPYNSQKMPHQTSSYP